MPDTRPHEPTDKTRAEVAALYSYGIPQEEIAGYLGIDGKTLRKYYRAELNDAAVKAHAKVGQFLFQNATGQTLSEGASYSDCVRAAMFWAKTRMGWSETNNMNVTNSDTLAGASQVVVIPSNGREAEESDGAKGEGGDD